MGFRFDFRDSGQPKLAGGAAPVKRAENFPAKFVVGALEVLGHVVGPLFVKLDRFGQKLAQELGELDGARVGRREMVRQTSSNL